MILTEKMKSILGALFFSVALYYSGFLVFLTPLPLVYMGFRHSVKDLQKGILVFLILNLLVYGIGISYLYQVYQEKPNLHFWFPIPMLPFKEYFSLTFVRVLGLFYSFYFAASALVIYYILNGDKEKIINKIFKALLLIVTISLMFFAMIYLFGTNKIINSYNEYIRSGFDHFLKVQESAGTDVDQLMFLEDSKNVLVKYIASLTPSFIAVILTLFFVFNFSVARKLFQRFSSQLLDLKLTKFTVPFFMIWVLIFALFLMVLSFRFFPDTVLHYIVLNFLISISVLFFIEGMAITLFYFDIKKIHGLFRLFLYFIIFWSLVFIPGSLFFFVGLGVFDHWANMREKWENKAKED